MLDVIMQKLEALPSLIYNIDDYPYVLSFNWDPFDMDSPNLRDRAFLYFKHMTMILTANNISVDKEKEVAKEYKKIRSLLEYYKFSKKDTINVLEQFSQSQLEQVYQQILLYHVAIPLFGKYTYLF